MKSLKIIGFRRFILFLMTSVLCMNIALAQKKVISGVVTGTDKEPIPGVTIIEKGTTNGTVSDLDGKYSLSVEPSAILVISFIGMETQEVPVGNRTILSTQLKESTIGLNEVVVVGYGTMMKKDLSSAISKVSGTVLHNQPMASAASLMVGKSTGVQVTTNSGAPGSDITVRIRGANSFNGNNPLYVIDGVPSDNILGINPNDIESMEVLKDASSSAIYGSRAANGVILITTKRGIKGKTDISFDAYYGLQRVYKKMPMMNAQQQWEYVLKGVANYNRLNPNSPVEPREQGLADYNAGYDTNWQDEVFRIAPVQNYSFSASGGNDKMRFSSNISYYNQKGVVISNGYERYTARFNMDYDLTSYLSVGTSLKGNYSHTDEIPKGDSQSSVMANLLRKMAYEPIYEPDGSYANRERPNLIASAELYQGDSYRTAGIGSVYAKIKILEGLELTTTWSADIGIDTGNSFFPSTILGGATRPSSAYSNKWNTWLSENILSYSFDYKKHKLSAILGYSMQETRNFNFNGSASGGPSDLISTMNASTSKDKIYSYKTGWGINSVFARANYSFASKYLVGLSIRNDGSSRFGSNNRYALFPAGSIAWRMNEEHFMKNLTMIDDLKIRASIGRTGNQNIGNYAAQGTYNTGVNYAGQPGVMVGGIPAADLTWESTDQYDAGIDLSMFKNRLTFSMDYYIKRTKGLLFSMPIPGYTGFGSYLTNLGKIENKGVEFSLAGDIIQNEDWNWSAGFNISFNKNKVLSLPNHTPIISTASTEVFYTTNGTFYTQEGHPIGEFYGLKWEGEVYPTDEIAQEHVSSIMGQKPVGGTLKYEDYNKDGKIDSNDRQVIGSPHPKFFGGFNTSVSYKNFDLGMQFSFMYGNKIFNQMRFLSSRGFCYDAARVERVNAWSKPGDITTEHKVLTSTDARDNQFSSKYVENGSYLRLNNLSIGYTLPSNISNILKLLSLRVYLSAQNLFTITQYKGYDPEVNSKASNIHTQGVDIGMIPQVSTYMLGLNVKF
ncbi:TonB-dependent receptor [uncultured Parabacteroides sp.]|uniref:SusC/RagA family TonB-linked outer membrane protein n=1 Tax=uncultured Parabacteroides sp. TaxID=512312 RepID=UPI00259A8BD9|nr:TonB-dependent receptor [uncultured Parabacteroides sp.]